MPVPLQKFREVVFQMLYSYDMGRAEEKDMIQLLMKELAVTKKIVQMAQERVRHVIAKYPEIDAMLVKASQSYEFERIQSVERNILRLGVFELFFDQTIPPKVAITEAMRLARKFGTPESAFFVNAILDYLYQESLGKTIDITKLDKSVKDLKKSEQLAKKTLLSSKNNPLNHL
jgi:transcription antitermination protein NusB